MSTDIEKERRDTVFAAHSREQQEYWDTVPFWEKLRWLEEAHRMVDFMQRNRADSEKLTHKERNLRYE